jgi:polysaccharide export outer membrane protein
MHYETGHHSSDVPKEFCKRAMPPYIIEPPDILLIETTQALEDQPIRGQHIVSMDGYIRLGIYGSVFVAGMTLEQAQDAIVAQLKARVKDADKKGLNVDILAYNSKFYYIITDGGGYGEQVYRLPYTGNETVLDAMSQINGLPPVADKKKMWVARATPADAAHPQILPIDWKGIAQAGSASTNYQIYPGDRIYVKADKWIHTDTWLQKRLSPIERLLGATLLGASTVQTIRANPNGGGNGNSGVVP